MKNIGLMTALLFVVFATTGCFTTGMNLERVAQNSGLRNVTTGDANTDNYTATGFHKTIELGFGIGIPFTVTLIEIAPRLGPETLLEATANDAREGGAEALINVDPKNNFFTGFPFIFAGIYVNRNHGTGIRYN